MNREKIIIKLNIPDGAAYIQKHKEENSVSIRTFCLKSGKL
jgi:hypothetical protein